MITLLSCGRHTPKQYSFSDFSSFSFTNPDFVSQKYCTDESQAMAIAGSYIYATITEHAFPTDRARWAGLACFTPLCLTPTDFDSIFTFSGYIGGWQDTPCQIDVNFGNGKTVKFCFVDIIYDTAKVKCPQCPEHSQEIITKSKALCK
jgi:hypothetical protein